MNEKIKNIICLCIMIIVPIILLILCGTGYSCRKFEVGVRREQFISTVMDYFKKPAELKVEEKDNSNDIPVEQATSTVDRVPFPPKNNIDNLESPKSNLPNMDHNYNKYSVKDIENNFQPKTTSVHKDVGNTLLDKTVTESKTHQNIQNDKDGLIREKISKISTPIKEIPILNSIGMPKAGPGLLIPNQNLFNSVNNSFKFFDETAEPNKDEYVYTGAEIGIDSEVPINFKCHGGKEAVPAEAVAKINEDGKVSEIIMLKKGSGYKNAKVEILNGGGSGAKAKAIVDDNRSISHIEIINGGKNYISTPQIKISNPNQNKKCKLYFKKNK